MEMFAEILAFFERSKNEMLTFKKRYDILLGKPSVLYGRWYFCFGGSMNKRALERLEMLNQIKLDDVQREDVLLFFAKREEEFHSLEAIDTSKTEPMVQVTPMEIELREDEIKQSFSREELQSQAPQTDAGYFCVPRVIE